MKMRRRKKWKGGEEEEGYDDTDTDARHCCS